MEEVVKLIGLTEGGKVEVLLAIEENYVRNLMSIQEFVKDSRKIVRGLEDKILHLESIIQSYDPKLEEMRRQLSFVQAKVYSGGT